MDSEPDPEGGYYHSTANLLFFLPLHITETAPMWTWEMGVMVFMIIVLIICSSLMSGSEVAYFSLGPDQLNQLKEKTENSAKRIIALVDEPSHLLATILIANNFFNIGIILTTYQLNKKLLVGLSPTMEFIISVVSITFILVLFGEVLPKVYATHHNLKLASLTSYPLSVFRRMFAPLTAVLVSSTKLIESKLQTKNSELNLEEIDKAIEIVSEDEESTKEDIAMLKGIIKFGNVTVKQIMRARVDVIAVEDTASFKDVCKVVIDSGHSRIPVYREQLDELLGILYAKDLLKYIHKDENFNWGQLTRKAYFVPESKKIDDLLKDFKQRRTHLAVVVDEYGGTSGIVTMEDILEEVVGEISDEFDKTANIIFEKIDDRTFNFDGKTLLRDICKVLDISPDRFDEVRGDSDSLAGLILEIEGKFPEENTSVSYENYLFTVLSQEENRIGEVKMEILDNANIQKEQSA